MNRLRRENNPRPDNKGCCRRQDSISGGLGMGSDFLAIIGIQASQRRAFQLDQMRAVNDAVEDRVTEDGTAPPVRGPDL
jgi:hypothetical protein